MIIVLGAQEKISFKNPQSLEKFCLKNGRNDCSDKNFALKIHDCSIEGPWKNWL